MFCLSAPDCRVSRMVKKEVEMFDVRRAEEFKAGVVTYLEAMLRAQVCTPVPGRFFLGFFYRIGFIGLEHLLL